ncbi:MAG: hypothetical protein RL148_1879 [Planctomycetota bacterium]
MNPGTTAPLAVRVQGLCRSFGPKAALDGLALEVATGELLGVVGPNGAGKSTLMRVLTGLVRRDRGEVSVLGIDPAHDSLAVRRRCSYLPGETSVYQHMTGKGFLDFAWSFHGAVQRDVADRLQELFRLPLHARVRSYSAGMKQKLAVLAALAPDVEVYLLDEPDRALDASVRHDLRTVLRELHGRRKTILLSSHHLGEVETLAGRLVFVVGGSVVPEATVAAARTRLSRRLRIRTRPGAVLTEGATLLAREADGVLLLETEGPPMHWLQRVHPDDVLEAEIGVLRLEELYQVLLAEAAR